MAVRGLMLLSRLRNPKDEEDDDEESYFWNCDLRVPLEVVSSNDLVCGIRSGCGCGVPTGDGVSLRALKDPAAAVVCGEGSVLQFIGGGGEGGGLTISLSTIAFERGRNGGFPVVVRIRGVV